MEGNNKHLFIINPYAGQRKAKEIKQILENKIKNNKKYKEHDFKVTIPSSVTKLNQEIKTKIEDENVSTVVAVGGDGTIATITQSIINYPDTILGIVPQGTGNILASNLGIRSEIDHALETIFTGNIELLDLGQVDGKPFTILAGTGVPANIIRNIKQEEKILFGIWAYFIKGLEHLYNAKEFSFRIDIDGIEVKTKSIAVFVSNAGNFLGPFPTITPQAEPHDGYLDVFIVSLKSLRENPQEYFQLLVNYLTRNLKHEEGIKSYRAKNITIESIPKLKVQADGDIVSETPTHIQILPKKLKVLVPKKVSVILPSLNEITQKIEEIFKFKISI